MIPQLKAVKIGLTVLLLVAVFCAGAWFANSQDEKHDAKVLIKHQKELAEALATAQKVETVEVTKYVEKIVRLPGRTVVRDRIVRLCQQGTSGVRPAVDSAVGDAEAAGDTDDRSLDGLAEDLNTAQINKARQAYMAELLTIIYENNK